MTLIEVNEISKIFQRGDEKIYALSDISFKIDAGEFVVLIGSSGSGKSTLMHILGLIDTPTKGRYLFNGVPTEEMSDDERSELRNKTFGFVFQGFHLLPHSSALRNVMMPLLYASSFQGRVARRNAESLARECLRQVGLEHRVKHYPNELSGGERQRVAIARALVNQPQVLFADEPTGNLDSKTGSTVLDLFSILHEKGTTIILVTHDPLIAERAPRKIELRDGMVIKETHARH